MEDYFKEDGRKTLGFYLMLGALLLFTVMGAGIDLDEYLQRKEINIPGGFFWLMLFVDMMMFAGIMLIYFYRKWGVYLFPVAVILHFFLHNYYLSSFLYTDVTNLFLFVSLGLLVLIPKWPYLK